MLLPVEYRDGWMKFPLEGPSSDDARVHSTELFKEGTRGRLYFRSEHLCPGPVEAVVWRIDRDGVVFRFRGVSIAPPPLDTIPKDRQLQLSSSWLWIREDP
jgi:hypothetical protein